MNIEAWFESMPSELVCEIAREKRFIMFAIHDAAALSFKNQDYIIKDILTMARKVKNGRNHENEPVTTKNEPKKSNGNGQKTTRWASADIRSKEHKSAIRELAKNPNFVLDTIVELVDTGYDLHIKRADEGATVRTMLFCHVPGDPNQNGGLSADAPDAWLSVSALVYKHVHILGGIWFSDTDDGDEIEVWK